LDLVIDKEHSVPPISSRERLDLRLTIAIPATFILVSLIVGLAAMTLTEFVLGFPTPSSKHLLLLRLSIVGSSLLAGLVGGCLAYGITIPIRRAISEAKQMIQYVESDPPPVSAANEVRALSALFDQAFVSFIELVQAREILDNIQEGIIALDRAGRVAGMNLKAQQTLEIPLSEARHKDLVGLLAAGGNNSILLGIAQSALTDQTERVHNRVPFSSRSGKEILFSIKASPLKLKREPQEFLGVIIALKEQPDGSAALSEVIGKSERFTEVLELLQKVGPTDSTVLLMGESGTGKEVIADALHHLSRRKDKPFIKLNCAAIPEGLLESELFGHEKGAFTGAVSRKPGKFELADGGTIFLDEIGDMSPATQTKVLRILQEREFMPLGGNHTKQVDVRILAATNKELTLEVQQGRFREDLFYRLNVVTINVPSLRERKSDIPLLADHFLEETAQRSNLQKKSLSRSALDRLLAYSWPGNIRELENAIERASLLSNDSVIQPEDLPIASFGSSQGNSSEQEELAKDWSEKRASLNETLEAVEKELIVQALKKSGGIQVEAAKILGLNHKNLWHKIRKHKIDPSELRNSD
jgi:transcriptional regulator with PAS, ATPase and Fis domain